MYRVLKYPYLWRFIQICSNTNSVTMTLIFMLIKLYSTSPTFMYIGAWDEKSSCAYFGNVNFKMISEEWNCDKIWMKIFFVFCVQTITFLIPLCQSLSANFVHFKETTLESILQNSNNEHDLYSHHFFKSTHDL